jgi:hypothetical protein
MPLARLIDRIAWWLDTPRDGVPDPVSGFDWFGRERRWRCQACDVLWWGVDRHCWVCGRTGVCEH